MCFRCVKHLFFLLVLLVSVVSCTTKKELVYLQHVNEDATSAEVKAPELTPYRIKEGDRLYIKVTSIDPETNLVFNTQSYNSMTSETSIDIVAYEVSGDGTITYPFVGDVKVENKTLIEVQSEMEEKVKKVAPQSSVVVKLVNRSITILGEVRSPGRYTVFKDQMTVFEALGFAGDITDYGSRTNVKIVRKVGNEQKVWTVDLTQEQLLANANMMVQPSDIVYVEPQSKVYGKKSFSISLALSIVSTFIALYATFLK
ncbi:polysaccharide export protein [Halosquirtibacter laminarini]|uniref:Polysaccharide export protein n=1 Tax=Halosquirtibacter laminarini TaxID=3374600 RepID=A0AC61NBQ3_9BACT|nr:polysaccharide export protein [Prolixibacteraceae bacterium]